MHPHFSLRRENRTSRLFGYVVSLTLAAGLNFLPETVALAQIQAPRQGGIPVGKFMFYPSGLLEFGRTNNVLYSSEDLGTIPSGIVIARINLLMDMPLGPHHIRWSYSPQFKDYTSDQFVNEYPISHFFNFESRFRVGRSFNIGFFDRYVRGVTELQEVDPGNEQIGRAHV